MEGKDPTKHIKKWTIRSVMLSFAEHLLFSEFFMFHLIGLLKKPVRFYCPYFKGEDS